MNKLNQYLNEASQIALKIAQKEMMQQQSIIINNNNKFNNYQYLMLGIHSTFQSFNYIMKNNNNNTNIYQVTNSGVFPMITYYNKEQGITLSTRSLIMNEHIFLTTNVKGLTRKISFPPTKFFKLKTSNNSTTEMVLDLELLGQVIFLKLILKYLPEPGFSTPELDGIPINCSRHIYSYLVGVSSNSSSSSRGGGKGMPLKIPYRNAYPVICSRTREASCV